MTTLKSLAAELGLSIGTVSLALSGSPAIRQSTIERVRKLAAERHYTPNNLGRALQSGHSRLIGCLAGSILNSFFGELIEGMGRRATQAGYGMMLSLGADSDPGAFVDQMLSHQVEGIIMTGGYASFREVAELLEKRGLPFVFCSTQRFREYPTVVNDDFASGVKGAECLLQCGHRRILVQQTTPEIRVQGACSVLDGRAEYAFFTTPSELPEAIRRSGATAVLTFSDLVAVDSLQILREAGFRIPEDISVLGHDNLPLFARPEFELTTIGVQRLQLGELAADYIIRASAGETVDRTTLLEPQLFFRQTVCSRPAALQE